METRRAIIYGDEPYRYAERRTGKLTEKVAVKTYTLCSGDWFEIGGAYSLHPTQEEAERHFNPFWSSYYKTRAIDIAFVTPDLKRKLQKEEIFVTWGH